MADRRHKRLKQIDTFTEVLTESGLDTHIVEELDNRIAGAKGTIDGAAGTTDTGSYNMSSSRASAGTYDITFSNAFASVGEMTLVATAAGASALIAYEVWTSRTTSAARVIVTNLSGTATDPSKLHIVVVGDLA